MTVTKLIFDPKVIIDPIWHTIKWVSGGAGPGREKGDSASDGGGEAQRFLPRVCMGEWTFSSKPEFVRESKSHRNVGWTSGGL